MWRTCFGVAIAALVALAGISAAEASTTVCSTVPALAATSHEWITSLGTNCTFAQSQPAVTDLANVGAGTVLGNATGSSTAPSATSTPVLGVASTTSGSLGLYSSTSANAVTIQAPSGATAAYNFNLPVSAGSAGQALISEGGSTTPMRWTTIASATLSVHSNTSSCTLASTCNGSTDDSTRYDNSGATGAVTFTTPSAPSAGNNWCFTVIAAQTLEVLATGTQTIDLGGTVSASAGNIQSNTVGSVACLYFESAGSTGKAIVWGATGTWSVT